MKIGLVLEGGSTRGMYTAGVLDTLMRNDIWADKAVGVSAGALFGVNYFSKQIGRAIRYNKKFNSDQNYMGVIPLLKTGHIIDNKYAFEDVPFRLDPFDDETFMNFNGEFYATVTNVETGEPEYIEIKSVYKQMQTLRASGSMPFVSLPIEIDGKKYLDGAVGDNVPFEWMKSQGVDKIIVILTQDDTYRKSAVNPLLVDTFYFNYPKLANGIKNRHNKYNGQIEQLREWEKEGKAFVIRPSEPIKMKKIERDPDVLQYVYDLGVYDTYNILNKLKEYLKTTED